MENNPESAVFEEDQEEEDNDLAADEKGTEQQTQ